MKIVFKKDWNQVYLIQTWSNPMYALGEITGMHAYLPTFEICKKQFQDTGLERLFLHLIGS